MTQITNAESRNSACNAIYIYILYHLIYPLGKMPRYNTYFKKSFCVVKSKGPLTSPIVLIILIENSF